MDAREAMDKLRDEMAAKPSDGAIQAIGQMLADKLGKNPALAEKIMNEKKTLSGAYKAMEDYAMRNRAGRTCVYVPPGKAMELLAEYFGVENIVAEDGEEIPDRKQETNAPAVVESKELDDLDIDTLLGL